MKPEEIIEYLRILFPMEKAASYFCSACMYMKKDGIGSEVCCIYEPAFWKEKESCSSFKDFFSSYSLCMECGHCEQGTNGEPYCSRNEPAFEDDNMFCEACTATGPMMYDTGDKYYE